MEESIAGACESVVPVIVHYDRDELAREETRAVREHLAACATCRHRLVVERALARLLRDLGRAEVPDGLEWRARRLLMDPRRASRPERRRRRREGPRVPGTASETGRSPP